MKKLLFVIPAIALTVALFISPNLDSNAGDVNVPFKSTGKSDIPF
ncbi:hypothetical protein SFC15_12520 [Shouchella clausii]